MDIYKEAAQQGLRVQTKKGVLSTEQLFGLSIDDLNETAVQLDEEYTKSGKKSFIVAKSVKDKSIKLKFDIVYDVLQTKLAEAEVAREKKEVKEHNAKILELINDKEKDELKAKSSKQLKAMLK